MAIGKDKIAQWSWKDHWARSIEEAISELEREAHVRQRCFDRWVEDGRVSYIDARDRQERLLSAIKLLRDNEELIAERDRLSSELATVIELSRQGMRVLAPVIPEEPQPGAVPDNQDDMPPSAEEELGQTKQSEWA